MSTGSVFDFLFKPNEELTPDDLELVKEIAFAHHGVIVHLDVYFRVRDIAEKFGLKPLWA